MVGEDAIVGPYTTLIDATVDEGAVVERSRVQESHIGARTNIGRGPTCARATSSARMPSRRVRRNEEGAHRNGTKCRT